MATNVKHNGNPNVALALAVASGTVAGEVVKIGDHLTGFCLTPRATTATIADGTAAPGLADGQATVELIGVTKVVELEVVSAAGVAAGDPVYLDATTPNTYTETATNNHLIGYALEAIDDEATGKVALVSSTPAAVTGS